MAASILVAREGHRAVWSSSTSEMIVWGGIGDAGPLADGAAYDPVQDKWTTLPAAPISARGSHAMLWTGTEVLIWGGMPARDDGALYNPSTKQWRAIPAAGPLSARFDVTPGLLTSGVMLFGGLFDGAPTPGIRADGAILSTAGALSWSPSITPPTPYDPRIGSATWTVGERFFMWSGIQLSPRAFHDTGYVFDRTTSTWSALEKTGAPSARAGAAVVWTGTAAIIWSGHGLDGLSAEKTQTSGAIYVP